MESCDAEQTRGATSTEEERNSDFKSVLQLLSHAVVGRWSHPQSPTKVVPESPRAKERHEVDDNTSHDGVARPHVTL